MSGNIGNILERRQLAEKSRSYSGCSRLTTGTHQTLICQMNQINQENNQNGSYKRAGAKTKWFGGILTQPATADSIADSEGPEEPVVTVATAEEVVARGRSRAGAGEERTRVKREEMVIADFRGHILNGLNSIRCRTGSELG